MSVGNPRTGELSNPGYELFIAGLSIISLANFVLVFLPVSPGVHAIAETIDIPISVVFLVDFAKRLLSAHPRRAYFINDFGNYRLRVLLFAGGIEWPHRPRPPAIRPPLPSQM